MNAEKIGHLADELQRTERLQAGLKDRGLSWQIQIGDLWVPKTVSVKIFCALQSMIEESLADLREEIRKAAGLVTK